MLEISQLGKSFGGLHALSDFSVVVRAGEILGLIGPNGSGKTTAINVLTGLYPASKGGLALSGQDLTAAKSEKIARAGIARTFQNLRLFSSQSVLDNVRTGQTIHCRSPLSRFSAFASTEEKQLRCEALALIERFGLGERVDWPAGSLSYGEKKRLEIARALAMRPKVLLLDEPAAGMNPVELEWLMAAIREIGQSGIAVILVEHHMRLIMRVCDNLAVLNFGVKIAEGPPSDIARHPEVIAAYLGVAH